MKLIFYIIIGTIVLQSCLVSRMQRPQISGYVYDVETNLPLADCKVGESYTDSVGYYNLKEKRYRKFTTTLMESRPLFVNEEIIKEGYHYDSITRFHPDGGGTIKGTHWKNDTVFLTPKH